MTQQQLADSAGVRRETIYRIELGRRPPSADTVYRIEHALDLPPQTLMPLWDDPPGPHAPTFGPKVRERRRALGMNLAEVASGMGCSVARLSRFERGLTWKVDLLGTRYDVMNGEHRVMLSETLARILRFRDAWDMDAFCTAGDARRWRVPGDRRSNLRFDPEWEENDEDLEASLRRRTAYRIKPDEPCNNAT